MDNSVIVSLRDIVVEFDGQRILDGLNLDIHDKEFVTLLMLLNAFAMLIGSGGAPDVFISHQKRIFTRKCFFQYLRQKLQRTRRHAE